MERFDVVVVGGGPAGAVTARVAAEAGARVVLLEQRTTTDGPASCAGLVSPRTLSVLGASDSCVLRRPRHLAIHAPDGTSLALTTEEDRALVIDRSTLETELLDRARAAAVDVRLGARATGWCDGVVHVETPAGAGRLAGAVLVGADGPEGQVAAWTGLPRARALRALQVELAGPDDAVVRVFVGRTVAPGFFAWSVPAQPGRLRVGLAVTEDLDPTPYLERLLATRFADRRVVTTVEGRIPIPANDPIVTRSALLVGDAAAQAKPLSGGGLYFGALCARLAGRAAARAARGEAGDLAGYERLARGALEAETRFGRAAAAVRDALDDGEWARVLKHLDRREVLAVAAEKADLDHLRHMVPALVARPRAWRALFGLWSILGHRIPSEVLAAGASTSHVARSNDEFL